ncbi:MAG: prephenate dehydrogenase/arogenate dehydrogenase family protein [Halobacteriota archaeon]|nr:prephenate dehydrogenase/arogenate dehydrogenase family protein [Halobacteriota archaeon]
MFKVTVVGGAGAMGQWFSKLFMRQGCDVSICDTDRSAPGIAYELDLTYEEDVIDAVSNSDIVLISVPMESTEAVIKNISPAMKSGSLLMEVASVKGNIPVVMKQNASVGVDLICANPLFGPNVTDPKGELIILAPVTEGGEWLQRIRNIFEDDGLKTELLGFEEHDEVVAVIQGLTHFAFIAIGETLRDLGFDLKGSRRYMSPFYKAMIDSIEGILMQNPETNARIQMTPESERVNDIFISRCNRLAELVWKRDVDGFSEEMQRAAINLRGKGKVRRD